MSQLIASTSFLNILVKVRPGLTSGTYIVETAPATPLVTLSDTVINYQIFDSDKYDIVFDPKNPMSVTPADNNQLSTASRSLSGKQLTFTDANTSKVTLNITLNFVDGDGMQFSHDPEVRNEPET